MKIYEMTFLMLLCCVVMPDLQASRLPGFLEPRQNRSNFTFTQEQRLALEAFAKIGTQSPQSPNEPIKQKMPSYTVVLTVQELMRTGGHALKEVVDDVQAFLNSSCVSDDEGENFFDNK